MTKKPIIGIIPSFNLAGETNDPYQDVSFFVRMYSDVIVESGGIPIGLLTENIEDYLSICDGYLWPGGKKVEKVFNRCIQDALENKKPFLGICLGAQALSTYLTILEEQTHLKKTFLEIYQENKEKNPYLKRLNRGNLHGHYVTKDLESINKAKHKVFIKKNSLLYSIYEQEEISVVSLHEVAIARTSSKVVISGEAEDDVVEAIEYTRNGASLLGVQWHPELVKDRKVFDWLISTGKKEK